MPSLLLLGCGQIGTRLAQRYISKGWSVSAIRRHPPEQYPEGLSYIATDLASPLSQEAVLRSHYIVYTPSPDRREHAAYQYLYETVMQRLLGVAQTNNNLALWMQISSTSVYGQNAGEWVDESTVVEPISNTARSIVKAERMLASALPSKNLCLRFSGIYGPNRYYLLKKVAQGIPLREKHWTNRIHETDCIGLMDYFLAQHASGHPVPEHVIGTDFSPVTEHDAGQSLARIMGVPPPPVQQQAHPSGKRCRSTVMVGSTGYRFVYPTLLEGYGAEIDRLNRCEPNWLARLS